MFLKLFSVSFACGVGGRGLARPLWCQLITGREGQYCNVDMRTAGTHGADSCIQGGSII